MEIYLLTKNQFKIEEISKIFKSYGLSFTPINSKLDIFNHHKENKTFEYIIIREETSLIRDQIIINSEDLKNLDKVTHFSKTIVQYFEKEKLVNEEVFSSEVEGFIDFSKRESSQNVYNWDDIFTEIESMKTYHEMKNKTNKFSARTKSISNFIESIIVLKEQTDLKFNPLNQTEVLSFNGEIINLIDNNKYLSVHKNNNFLSGLVKSVKNEGLFTRSPLTKSQRNYWYPSLNAGLPLVPKKDEIHEITFMFHDLMHHCIPDLILTGEDSKEIKEAYIIHRMLSEAITIVLADMVFIDELVNEGYQYDWSKRKIYPVYESFKNKQLLDKELKDLVWANINFALLGNIDKLLTLSETEAVINYKEKYEKFFIEDYRWTINNYDNMMSSKEVISNWYENCKELIPKSRVVTRFSNLIKDKTKYHEKVEVIFEEVWKDLLYKSETYDSYSKEDSIKNAFIKYMLGQMLVFFKYDYEDYSNKFFTLIKKELTNEKSIDISKIKDFYNIYLNKLKRKNLISEIEYNSYKDIFPMFEVFFVFYDKNLKFKSIKEVLKSFEIS